MASAPAKQATPKIASPAEWLAARKELLAKEKELTHLRDSLAAQRREMPWLRIEKDYTFDTPKGKQSLSELFDGHSQLIVYHFMLGPESEAGCPSCSLLADSLNPLRVHVEQRDVNLILISRAPLAKIETFQKRMGWTLPWASSYATDFNFDFGVSFDEDKISTGEKNYNYGSMSFTTGEAPGLSVFAKNADGSIFHSYSTYARGLDPLVGVYQLLDLTPKGRNEDGLPWPMAWVRHHDRYDQPSPVQIQPAKS
jgi:predicted dithiol-disulfide oxidoreductase (DUF899 family)